MDSDYPLFLAYAYTCGELQRDALKTVTDEKLALVREMIGSGEVEVKLLRSLYAQAFRRLEEVAQATGLAPLSTENIDAYFLFYHNAYIDAGDGNYATLPLSLCEYCKVRVVKIVDVLETRMFTIAPLHAETVPVAVASDLVPQGMPGDLLVIHQGSAVQSITEERLTSLEKHAATELLASLRARALRARAETPQREEPTRRPSRASRARP